ncbi:response regulator [Bordetella genomosp. 11]|uniref:DNA-binding response regulator n=1 Tax=Bordetella genomosp. 11 TaxID=1416808 RepID=A0A261URE3_9BORD|nr:response regulator [Bordetella genomosp. 11]OZI64464.1 DNA-binding response regulator [Bordetella genomosp. 11]
MRLLLIEDDAMIAESLFEALRRAGYAVDRVGDGRQAELATAHDVYDLILLDLGLPVRDGIALLKDYRKRGGRVPVLIVTARDSVADRIGGLDAGADDYMVKPFDIDELGARVRALLRRRHGNAMPVHVHGDLRLDPMAHEAHLGDTPLTLVPREFALLHALIEEPRRVFTREQLEEKLYGWNEEVGSNTIEVYIHSLRRKMGAKRIVTVRGVGYRLAAVEHGA